MSALAKIKRTAKSWLKKRVFGLSDRRFRQSLGRRLERLRAARKGAALPPTYVVMAPSSLGNIGDEAMITATVRGLRSRGVERIVVLAMAEEDRFDFADGNLEVVALTRLMRPAGWGEAHDRFEAVLRRGTHFVLIGADTMDGGYLPSLSLRRLWLAGLAARAGLQTSVVGFSFKSDGDPAVRTALAELSADATLCVRDPVSFARVAPLARGPVHLGADLAFRLEPATAFGPAAQAALRWIAAERAAGRTVLGYNANPLGAGMALGAKGSDSIPDLDAEAALLARTVALLLEGPEEHSFVFVAHDYRRHNNDVGFLRAVHAALPPEATDRVFLALADLRAAEVKALCRQLDFVVSGRMHFGIAALGAGTPCMFLDYMGKVQGLLDHFGVPELGFTMTEVADPPRFAALIADQLAARDAHRAKIAATLPRIRALSALNLDLATGTAATGAAASAAS